MADNYSPVIYLFRDTRSNTIRAASVRCDVPLEDGFLAALVHSGNRYDRIPSTITFWNHLSHDGNEQSPVHGICLYLMRPGDNALLDSPFCTSSPSNMRIESQVIHEITLVPKTRELSSDSAQAFGSQYFSDGTNVIMALGGWPNVRYDFPIDERVIHAAQ
jgi:hypothetical protein